MSRKRIALVAAVLVLLAVAVGGAVAVLTHRRATVAGAASPIASVSPVDVSPPASASPSARATPSVSRSPIPAPPVGGRVGGIAVQQCPSTAQVIDAAMAKDGSGRPIVVTVGPRCASGWAAAIVGPKNADTSRIVLKRGSAGFVVVVYQPAMEPCPASLATMPHTLRTAVGC